MFTHSPSPEARAWLALRRLVVASIGASALSLAAGATAQAEPAATTAPGCSTPNATIPALRYQVCVVTRGAPNGAWARSVVRVINTTGTVAQDQRDRADDGERPRRSAAAVPAPAARRAGDDHVLEPGIAGPLPTPTAYARAYGTVQDIATGQRSTGHSPRFRPTAPVAPAPVPPTGPGNGGFPPDVTTAPDVARYDDAGLWRGTQGCSGTFTIGSKRLQDWIRSNWGAANIGGYSCRRNTGSPSKTSIHGVGRASDWFRNASNATEAAQVAGFIWRMTGNGAAMARATGVQYWIWNKKQYKVNQSSVTVSNYTGPNPHTDHVHIEQNLAGSQLRTSYWILAG